MNRSPAERVFFPWLPAVAAVICSALLACTVGALPLSLRQVVNALVQAAAGISPETLSPEEFSAYVAVARIRLARICLALATGSGLAVSGVVFQGILRNPLADPFTLGVSGGAAFGASLGIALGLAANLLPAAALGGAAAALVLVLFLGRSGGFLQRETLVLAGVVTASFLAALISLVKALDEESVTGIVFWIMGSFQNRGWQHMPLLLPGFFLGLVPVLLLARELDILALGDSCARQLGLNVGRSRFWLLLGASAITASCVAVAGIIGFVGLIVPHLMRLLLGPRHIPLLAASALAGAFLLLWADVLARSCLPGGLELPVGVVTALLGGPFFCSVLRKNSRKGLAV